MFIVSICYQVNWSLNVNSVFDIVLKKKIGAPSLKEAVNINRDPIRQRLCLQLFDFTVFCYTCLKIQFSAVNSQSIYTCTFDSVPTLYKILSPFFVFFLANTLKTSPGYDIYWIFKDNLTLCCATALDALQQCRPYSVFLSIKPPFRISCHNKVRLQQDIRFKTHWSVGSLISRHSVLPRHWSRQLHRSTNRFPWKLTCNFKNLNFQDCFDIDTSVIKCRLYHFSRVFLNLELLLQQPTQRDC